jgi:hypothetical protein
MYYTKEEIIKQTNLELPFINRCLKKQYLKPLFEERGYLKKGQKYNKILFTDAGRAIFNEIKRLKDEGLSLNQVKEHLQDSLPQTSKIKNEPKSIQTNKQSVQTNEPNFILTNDQTDQTSLIRDLFKQLQTANNEIKEEKEKRILEKDEKLELEKAHYILKKEMLLLTDGKSPEEIRRNREIEKNKEFEAKLEKQNRTKAIKDTVEELKKTSSLRVFKKAKLYKKIEDLSDSI